MRVLFEKIYDCMTCPYCVSETGVGYKLVCKNNGKTIVESDIELDIPTKEEVKTGMDKVCPLPDYPFLDEYL